MKTILAALLILTAATPALADRESRRDMSPARKVGKCLGDYREEYPGQCVDIVLKNSAGQQAILEHKWRRIYCADPLARNEPECRRGRR